jgi:hypothetical protein
LEPEGGGVTHRGIVLGVGAPNRTRDGSKTMCAIILSEDLGFIRVYPIPADEPFPVWSRVIVVVEKTANDNRPESHKLLYFEVGPKITEPAEKWDILESCVLKSGVVDPIDYCNERRTSIAMVKIAPNTLGISMSPRAPALRVSADDDEHSWVLSQDQHWQKPYLEWASEQGKGHNTHLVGREVYMGLQNNPTRPMAIYENMGVAVPDFQHWLLLGNMKDRRNVWVGVHLHRLKKQSCGSIPLFCAIRNGKPAAWPYCAQETSNVAVVDNQLEMFTTEAMTSANFHGNTAMIA